MKKILTFVLTVAMLLSMTFTSVFAAEGYTYTIRIYAGNQGKFVSTMGVTVTGNSNAKVSLSDDGDMMVITNLNYNDKVTVTAQTAIALDNNSKYYVRGVRLSGHDNDAATSIFYSTEDLDLVVAYGIRGNQVEYTVNYEDAQGNTLAPSETFYGNIGDKPVVAYQYIEGYAPQALGLTKTLSSEKAENVFTFVYSPMPTPTQTPGTQEGTTTPGTQDQGTQTPGTQENQGAEEGTTVTPGTTEENQPTGEVESEASGEVSGESENAEDTQETTGDIIDLDDEEVPLADQAPAQDKGDSSLGLYVGMSAVGIIALAAIVVVIIAKKRSFK